MGKIWDHSNQIEWHSASPAIGALAYFFVGSTTTPLTVYQDADESTPHEHPVEADGNGRWPTVFIPFTTSYDNKVTTAGGTQLYYPTEIPNPNPVEAGEDTVDDTQLIQTGDVIWSPVDETRTGFVRCNSRTIGNAASGATERANADTEDLFLFLWNKTADAQCPVSGGRGASAAADYAANKTITLLDGRSGTLRGLDDMGNTAGSFLGSAPFTNGDAVTPGSLLGANSHVITEAQLDAHEHAAGTLDNASEAAHTHGPGTLSGPVRTGPGNVAVAPPSGAATVSVAAGGDHAVYAAGVYESIANVTMTGGSTGAGSSHDHAISGSTATTGSGTAHNNVSRGLLGTYYQKL